MPFSRSPQDNNAVEARHRVASRLENPIFDQDNAEDLYKDLKIARYELPFFRNGVQLFHSDMKDFVSPPRGLRALNPFYVSTKAFEMVGNLGAYAIIAEDYFTAGAIMSVLEAGTQADKERSHFISTGIKNGLYEALRFEL